MSNQSTNGIEASVGAAPQDGLMPVAEAIIFAADSPVPAERVAEIYAEVTGQAPPANERVEAAVEQLNRDYEVQGRAFRIHKWSGGYRMATTSDFSPFVKLLLSGSRVESLSRSLMETLAIVAYRQPITRPEVDFIRGVSAGYAMRKLLEMGLIDVEGRSDSLGRPLLYGTTDLFLEQFGMGSLEDLPNLREIEELLDDPHFNEERAKLLTLKQEEELSESNGETARKEDDEAETEDDRTSDYE